MSQPGEKFATCDSAFVQILVAYRDYTPNMDPLDAALQSILSLKPGEKPNYTQIAKKYGVGRDRLARRHRGVQGSRAEKYENERLLTPAREGAYTKYRFFQLALLPSKDSAKFSSWNSGA